MRLNQLATSSLSCGWFSPGMLETIGGPVSPDLMAECSRIALDLDCGGACDLAACVIAGEDKGEPSAAQRSWICQAGYGRIVRGHPMVARMVERGELTVTGSEATSAETVISEVVDLA
jgi:hypothetical protein